MGTCSGEQFGASGGDHQEPLHIILRFWTLSIAYYYLEHSALEARFVSVFRSKDGRHLFCGAVRKG
jgi:hypothetical protein